MIKNKYGAFISEDMLSSRFGDHLYSCVDETQDVENGWVGFIGDPVEGEKNLYNLEQPTAALIEKEELVVVMQAPEVLEGFSRADFRDEYFINEEGEAFRCYKPRVGDVFGITDYTIDALNPVTGIQKGNYVIAQDGSNRLKEVAALVGTEVFVGQIRDFKGNGSPIFTAGINFNGNSNLTYASIYTLKNSKIAV